MSALVETLFVALGAVPVFYLALVFLALLRRDQRTPETTPRPFPGVSVLKPLCGVEPGLYENLRSYCDQDYPLYQVIFGVRDPRDLALAVVERLIRDFPERDIRIVVDARITGQNYKVSNLANMAEHAEHEILVMADSDTRVGRDYLRAIAVPFADSSVGGATCLYRGRPFGGLASVLGAMHMNDVYIPAVRLILRFQTLDFCFGQTMVIRRRVLDRTGGLQAIANHVADDFMLGQLIVRSGHQIRIVPYLLDNMVHEPSLTQLFQHELRWARTIRCLRPRSYPFTFVLDAIPVTLVGFLASGLSGGCAAVLGAALIMRLAVHYASWYRLGRRVPATPWLIPIRDALTFAVRVRCFMGNEILWRGRRLHLRTGGYLTAERDGATSGAVSTEAGLTKESR